MEPIKKSATRKVNYAKSFVKIIILVALTSLCLELTMFLFQWNDITQLPIFLRPYSVILLKVSPFLRYINATIIIILGYIIVGELGSITYQYMRRYADHSSAATVEKIVKITGLAIIISLLASVFSMDPSAALTFGSLTGLVIGLATQTFISNAIAGVFILITRPFTFGDVVTIQGNTGVVKELRILQLVLETTDRTKDIMIPNSLVMSQIIHKEIPGKKMGPIPSNTLLDRPEESLKIGTTALFTGRLIEEDSQKPIINATVKLVDSDIIRDEVLKVGLTNLNGDFEIEWKVQKVDRFDEFAEIFVKYDGDENHRPASSKKYNIRII